MLFLILAAALPTAALADVLGPVQVINPSFETLPASGLPSGCGTGCTFSNLPIPGWSGGGTSPSSGQIRPGAAQFSSLSSGPTSAYSNGPIISQTVGTTVQAGVTYILMVDLGFRLDTSFAASADLLLGNGMIIPATGVTPIRGNWSTFTAIFTGTAAEAGQPITIQLRSSGSQASFDNVRLDAVPEPGTLGLLGTGIFGIAGTMRRMRRRSGLL